MLIDHNAVLMQGLKAVTIKLPGKKTLSWTERIRGIHKDDIVFVINPPDILQPVLIVTVYPRIIQLAGSLGQVLFADIHHFFVDFHQINGFNEVIFGQLADCTAVTTANYQHLPDIWVNAHSHMGYHFVVNEFILFRQHQIPVQGHNPAKFLGIKYIYPLKITFAGIQLFIHLYGKIYIFRMLFCVPQLHLNHLISLH